MTRIFISAGETSGDEHAAQVVRALKNRHPELSFSGMGGTKMRAAGVHTIIDSEISASVMGFGAVIKSLGSILDTLKKLKLALEESRPDLLIVCDYPDFHFRLIKHAKKLGIPVLYYITPSVWAWRSSRVQFIKEHVDRAAVIFPFERKFFESRGYFQSVFVGNPLVEEIENHRLNQQQKLEYLKRHNLNPEKPVVAIFPGSRKQEILRHCDPMYGAFQDLRKSHPDLQALTPIAANLKEEQLRELIPDSSQITFSTESSLSALQIADFGVLKSGTSNIQAAFYGLPFFMFYGAPIITEIIVRSFVRVKEYSMVNIIQAGTIKELVSYRARRAVVKRELEKLLENPEMRTELKNKLLTVAQIFAGHDQIPELANCHTPAERVSELALQLLNGA